MSREYIVIGADEWPVEIESEGEYVGDPLELVGTNTLVISPDARCVKCGEADWDVEFLGYCNEEAYAVCICGESYRIQTRKDEAK